MGTSLSPEITPEKPPQSSAWELTLLGCGTSTGVPLLFCECEACSSPNPRNKRLRASAWIKIGGKSILIDTSTDLRQQALIHRIPRVDAILFTHPHADHVSGIDDVRSFNYLQRSVIPAYGNAWTCTELRTRFSYLFKDRDKVEGGGVAMIDLYEFDSSIPVMDILGVQVIPVSVQHGSQECIAYRLGSVAYATDCNGIPDESVERLRGLDTLVLDCLRLTPHGTHFHLEAALKMAERIGAKRTVLTHLGHDLEYEAWSQKLPPGVSLAYDGMVLSGS
jgi:phosphoribosyl 1,2-cyclic phosphate phosphodiesterase